MDKGLFPIELSHLLSNLATNIAHALGKGYQTENIEQEVDVLTSQLDVTPMLAIAIGETAGLHAHPLRQKFPNIEIHIFEPTEVNFKKRPFADYWRQELAERHIDIVKIDLKEDEWTVLKGFGDALAKTRVIQFKFSNTSIHTRTFFHDLYFLLTQHGFLLYRITPHGLLPIPDYQDSCESFTNSHYIARNTQEFHTEGVISILTAIFSQAHSGTLDKQVFDTTRQNLLDAGNTELADALTMAHHSGIANAFNAAVHAAQEFENTQQPLMAMQSWKRAMQLNEGSAEAFTRHGLLGMRLAWGEPPPPRAPDMNRHCITSTRLGIYGRFANQLFQYGFMRCYAARHNLEVQTPIWIGRYLFDLDDPLPSRECRSIDEKAVDWFALLEPKAVEPLVNVDIFGYFIGHTATLAPYRSLWQSSFTLSQRVAPTIEDALRRLRQTSVPGATLVALHLRRGDYGYGPFQIAPAEWYLAWLETIWESLNHPILYVASDDPSLVTAFARFHPVSDTLIAPTPIKGAEYLIDFEMLRHADLIAISISTFSMMACMLAYSPKVRCFCPDFASGGLFPFDPWNNDILLNLLDKPKSISASEQWLIDHFLHQKAVICHLGDCSVIWTRAVLKANADHTIHTLSRSLTDVDHFYRTKGISHINLLHLGAEEDPFDLLKGSARLFKHARIDTIAMIATPEGFPKLRPFLTGQGYYLFSIKNNNLIDLSTGTEPDTGDLCLAIHGRLIPLLFNHSKTMIDLAAELKRHAIVPKGVIHIGAHEGGELATYRAMGISPIVFIEANPAVYTRLVATVGQQPDLFTILRAVSDRAGVTSLHLMSADMSSSILPPARHNTHYPSIVEVGSVEVETSPLDDLMAEFHLDPTHYTILSLDIQGAELAALRGACEQLRHIEAINVEVNFEELYTGCAQIDEMDDFLEEQGFIRVALTCPWHASWGDALYVRRKFHTDS
ncbi:MAG: FkbM family methyltransferase [Magnetococcales bacterium]|nr:FkbM family methyltransferase [Magnetococcales bacterium]